MSDESTPTFGRYARVRKAMQGMPALKRLMGKETVVVMKPDRKSEYFAPEVTSVTEALERSGKDAGDMSQQEIIHFATNMLVLNQTPPVAVQLKAVAPESEVKSEPAPEPKGKAAAEEATAEVAPKIRTAKPKPVRKIQPPRLKTTRVPIPTPAPVAESVKPAAKLALTPTAKNGSPIIWVRPHVPFVVGTAILSNLEAVNVLLQPYVKADDPEAKELLDKVNSLMDDVHRRTVLPNCAKED
jgi:hypothetical protein